MKYGSLETKPYRLIEPEALLSGIVIASPHSGRNYLSSVKEQSILDPITLRSSEDAFVDELMDFAPALGIPLICSEIPRAFVDLNRARDELDPAIIEGIKPNRQNPRVISGLGVIPRVVANGKEIYSGKLSKEAAIERLENFWDPYHSKLAELLDRARQQFGYSILIDTHSMPHEAILNASSSFRTSQIVLGDRYGATCAPEIINDLIKLISKNGLRASRNIPFSGAYIVQKYGSPGLNRHAIQLEIDRSIYMDERKIQKLEKFRKLKNKLQNIMRDFSQIHTCLTSIAAE
jgi:N-formylglutamate amidohydrolase